MIVNGGELLPCPNGHFNAVPVPGALGLGYCGVCGNEFDLAANLAQDEFARATKPTLDEYARIEKSARDELHRTIRQIEAEP